MSDSEIKVGSVVELHISKMAHGGEGIAHAADGRVVFVAGGFPGDVVRAAITQAKKRFLRAEVREVITPGKFRGPERCPAAAAGAGCCDFSALREDKELEVKTEILNGQLSRVVDLATLPDYELLSLQPTSGWRTRTRLGVDDEGRAGMRKRGSNDVVFEAVCTQLVSGLARELVGANARRFSPRSEIIAVIDSSGQRVVIETQRPSRGRRVERANEVLEGRALVREDVDKRSFSFPPTAFWQAHSQAPQTYVDLVRRWLGDLPASAKAPIGWDLYGGVGLFVPAIADNLGLDAELYSVDYSSAANARSQEALAGYNVAVKNDKVESALSKLPDPRVVVLDPPRTGAGSQVVDAISARNPERVIHVGCDAATFSRDLGDWIRNGYRVERMAVIDAFPQTHHFEVFAQLGR